MTVTPLLPVVASLMAGITIAHWCMPSFPLLYVLVAVVPLSLACRRWPVVQSMAIYCCCFVLGMTLMQMQHDGNDAVYDRELEAIVMSEPAVRPKTIGVDLLVPQAGGRTLRCYIRKDERSRKLRIGEGLVVRLDTISVGTAPFSGPPTYFVGSRDWHPGGSALSQMPRWQRLRLWFLQQRHYLLQRYRDFNADEDTYAVLAAMTLGDKSAQTRDLREAYSVSGASHVLAISGLHIGVVYMLLTWLMLGHRRFWLSQVLMVTAIWAFALLTGLSPSVARAAMMISLYAVFSPRGGHATGINVLCFAAIVMLVADATALFDISFQLSFSAVFAILLFMPPLQGIYQPQNAFLHYTWNLLLLSAIAQVGVAPLIAYHFGRFSIYFLLTNLLVIPAAIAILYGALVSLLCPPASVVLLWVVRVMNGGLRVIASLPGACIDGLHPTLPQVALTYVFFGICYLILRHLPSRSSANAPY